MLRCCRIAVLAAALPQAAAQQALSVTPVAPLAFGRFAAGTGGQVTISAGGVRTASGGVVLLSSAGGSPAQFSLAGEPHAAYSIGLPADGSVVLTNAAGHTMPVQSFFSSPSGSGQLGPGGTQTMSVGASLGVAAGQRVGNYSGSFQVFLNYN
ncbi:DUF4402 domain-containing protein [Ramlibacter tataouinensis]|uniref:DUF4402 domain-containing protein n=1 Tax=Ramlibacter tataouinensis (strain ATCC BAA-407 / DSM 14655 / LMG 21543 / TTB310) TaxID=365046 RepID=F5XXP3_RAMTT|nr:DUF4402 domain-containing protein [Ramlibacter tataouinensis]AEG91846.1 Hypothetical protein Rta_07650 [Ramlibacter tataouinensis TTB310]